MSFELTRQLIAVKAASISLPFPVQWEGGQGVGPQAAWGRWSIIQGETQPAVIGPGHTRGSGFLVLQVFLAEETGTKVATLAADTLAAALDRVQLRSGGTVVTFDTVGMVDAGTRAGYLQKNLACNFTRDTYS